MAESVATSNTTAGAARESTFPPTSFTTDPYDAERTFVPIIIVTKVIGLLSAMGSSYIIYNMIMERETKLKRTFDRLLLSLCVADFISSVSIFLGSW